MTPEDAVIYVQQLRAGIIPESIYVSRVGRDYVANACRDSFIDIGMYGLVDMSHVRRFVDTQQLKGKHVLEIMAGNGYLTKAIRDCGVKIIGTDNGSWYRREYTMVNIGKIIQMDCMQAIREHGPRADALICSWPYCSGPAGDAYTKAALLWDELFPDKPHYYYGECAHGVTATLEFFDLFEVREQVAQMPTWQGYWDAIYKVKKRSISLHDGHMVHTKRVCTQYGWRLKYAEDDEGKFYIVMGNSGEHIGYGIKCEYGSYERLFVATTLEAARNGHWNWTY